MRLGPLRPAGFPRTTSGKLQRYLLRQRLERGEFDAESARMAELVAAEEARRAVKGDAIHRHRVRSAPVVVRADGPRPR